MKGYFNSLVIIIGLISPVWVVFNLGGLSFTFSLIFPLIIAILLVLLNSQLGFSLSRITISMFLMILSVIVASVLRYGLLEMRIDYKSFIQYCFLYILWMFILRQIFKDYRPSRVKNTVYWTLLIFLVFNGILSVGSYLELHEILFIVDNLYSAETIIDGVMQSATLGDGTSARRTIGMFSSSTQLGAFGALGILMLNGLDDGSRNYVHIFLGTLVVISSESRTALVILILVAFISLRKNGAAAYVFILPIFGLTLYLFKDLLLSERVLNSLNSVESFKNTGEKQRLFYWLLFLKRVTDDPLILAYGLEEIASNIVSKKNFFESEYFNLVARAGILGLSIYIGLLLDLFKKVNRIFNERFRYYFKYYVLFFIILGVTQGMFFSPRFILLNAIVYTAVLRMSDEKYCLPHNT
jgi:hypothetical protein